MRPRVAGPHKWYLEWSSWNCTSGLQTKTRTTLNDHTVNILTAESDFSKKCAKNTSTHSKWKKEWASSHTPLSIIAWECCIQWMAIPSITGSDGQSDKKGDINCSSKGSNQHFLWICISTHYVLHNYKVSSNSVKQFQWRCADQLFQ